MTSLLINFNTFSQLYLHGRLVSYGESVTQHTLVHPLMYRGSLVQSLFFENQTGQCRPVFNSASYLLLQFFLSFRFKVEQWLILAILVFVPVILFARVCRVVSRPFCHDTLSCYGGTIVYGYIGLICRCFFLHSPIHLAQGILVRPCCLLGQGSLQLSFDKFCRASYVSLIMECVYLKNMYACIFNHMQRHLSPIISQFSCVCVCVCSQLVYVILSFPGIRFLSPGIMSLVLRTCPSCLG